MGLIQADARHLPLANQSVHCCVTSPPYFGLRDYGISGQIGLEQNIEDYVAGMVAVGREIWRVLRDDGTFFLNLGDSYFGGKGHNGNSKARRTADERGYTQSGGTVLMDTRPLDLPQAGLKPKDLCMIPARVALALQADGWYLRSDIIWHKNNPMPESVQDRCTRSYEHIFMFSKQPRYYFDAVAIAEPASMDSGYAKQRLKGQHHQRHNKSGFSRDATSGSTIDAWTDTGTRNKRDVWTVATSPCKEAHFATFPPALITPCILAGTSDWGVCAVCGAPWVRVVERTGHINRREPAHAVNNAPTKTDSTGWAPTRCGTDTWRPTCNHEGEPIGAVVLDPFCGSGTTGQVCNQHRREFIGLDLSYVYLHDIASKRVGQMTLRGC
jgi:DNA modification methylase